MPTRSAGLSPGLRAILDEAALDPRQIRRVVHATTLFTNALIERKGAQDRAADHGGLPRRAGDRPRAQIRALRPLHRDAQAAGAAAWRREVDERLAPTAAVANAARRRRRAEPRSPTWWSRASKPRRSCFLHAYANPAHERAIGAAIAERFRNCSISLSSDVAPEIREYLRAWTTVANAYVRPLAEIYLERLEQRAARPRAFPAALFLMLSNGGLTHVSEAKRAPVQLLESGPAAGALAGAWFGRNAGLERVLAFDMGGTTAKLAPGRRRRAAGRLRLRGGAREALPARLRPADPDRHGRADRDRRRRRLDRAQRASSARSMSGRRAAAPQPGPGLLRPRRHRRHRHRCRPDARAISMRTSSSAAP